VDTINISGHFMQYCQVFILGHAYQFLQKSGSYLTAT